MVRRLSVVIVPSPNSGGKAVNKTTGGRELSVAESRRSSWLGVVVERLTVFGERAGNALVYSSAYLAAISMVYVSIVIVLLGLPANLAPVVGGLVTFAVYANDRLVDVDADAKTNPDRTAFVLRHEKTLYVLAALAYGIAVALSVTGGPITLAVTLMPGVFWVLYATSWIPDVLAPFRRLKEVLVVNSATVAFAWAASATLLPMGFADATLSTSAVVVFAYFFLRSFTNSEIPNVRDVEGDRATGVATLPVVFGVERTRRILYGIDFLTIALVGYAAYADHLSAIPALALLVGLAYSLCVTSFVGRTRDEDVLVLAAECEYLVVGLALVPVVYAV